MMRLRTSFGPTAIMLCMATMISDDLDSTGAGGTPPKGDDHVAMPGDDITIGGDSDKVKVDEGARDMTDGTTGDPPLRDEVPIGTFMGDNGLIIGERLTPPDPLLETERIAA